MYGLGIELKYKPGKGFDRDIKNFFRRSSFDYDHEEMFSGDKSIALHGHDLIGLTSNVRLGDEQKFMESVYNSIHWSFPENHGNNDEKIIHVYRNFDFFDHDFAISQSPG